VAIIDPARGPELRTAIEAAGFHAECFSTATAALTQLRTRAFALAILDLALRDTDPFAVCREISRTLPIITITSDGGEEACVRALECGADDCVPRTTSGRELIARIRNVLRRSTTRDEKEYDSLSVSISEMRIRTATETHDLTRGETELLAVLIQHAPAPLPVRRIAELLSARRGTIESRIKSLRRKLGGERLVSRGGLGYQLVQK
jgi:DNA-binding response OmpR family regulator